MKIRTWDNSEKRFGIACFVSAKPANPEADGDAFEAFDDLGEARIWMERAYRAGRFRHFTVWDGISGSWEQLEYFPDEATHEDLIADAEAALRRLDDEECQLRRTMDEAAQQISAAGRRLVALQTERAAWAKRMAAAHPAA